MLDELLRALVEDVVRRVLDEKLALLQGSVRGDGAVADDTGRYLTLAETSRIAGVSVNTVRSWVAGGLPPHRRGRVVRIKRRDLDRFLREQETDCGPDPDKYAAEILARRERR